MIRSPTLLVVGAGASCEAGLPTGVALKTDIAQKIDIGFEDGWNQSSGDHEITAALRRHAAHPDGRRGDINPYLHAAWKIRDAMPQALSIDNFIDAHRGDDKMELCGKLGIVRAILDAERRCSLFVDESQGRKMSFGKLENTWYHGLMQILSEGIPRSEISKLFTNLSFIVFNYDRCIEHFLLHALRTYYAIPDREAQDLINSLTIIHPYGAIGPLPWQPDAGRGLPFGGSSYDLLESAQRIKTFTERVEDNGALDRMREEACKAKVVVFLGFAFHPQNLELIKPNAPSNVYRVFATALGISKSDCEVVRRQIHGLLQKDQEKLRLELRNDLTCAGLFKEFCRSLSLG